MLNFAVDPTEAAEKVEWVADARSARVSDPANIWTEGLLDSGRPSVTVPSGSETRAERARQLLFQQPPTGRRHLHLGPVGTVRE